MIEQTQRILVVAATLTDAEAAAAPLRDDFADIVVSSDPQSHVDDFDAAQAPLCVLGFRRLGMAEQYLIRLERSSGTLHAFAQRRVVLCDPSEAPLARALCQQGRFDDYVPFWPQPQDAQRLPMAVHHAAHLLLGGAGRTEQLRAWVEQAQRLERLEARLASTGAWAIERVDAALLQIRLARKDIAEGAPDVEQRLGSLENALGWMRHWALCLDSEWASELAAVRRLRELAGRAQPVVLAVDDDEFQHRLLRRMLGDRNIELLSAGSVSEAMSILQQRVVDCILMDIGLPDVDGISAVKMIKSIRAGQSVHVVMMTGSRDEAAMQRSLEAGASGFIAKPFNRVILLTRLQAVLAPQPRVG